MVTLKYCIPTINKFNKFKLFYQNKTFKKLNNLNSIYFNFIDIVKFSKICHYHKNYEINASNYIF